MRLLLLASLLFFCRFADAITLTDSWWSPGDAGWGLSLVHDGDTLTVGLFTHHPEGEPRWYSGALKRVAGSPRERPEFTGLLHETRRVPDGETRTTVVRQVGEIAFGTRDDGKAQLAYTLDGVAYSKQVERFTFTDDRLEGLHFATMLPSYDSCRAGFQALPVFVPGVLSSERCDGAECGIEDPRVPRDRSPIHINFRDATGEVCRIDGRFTRYGRSGGIVGTYACRDGGRGNMTFSDIEFTSIGFSARFVADHPDCGRFGGVLSGVRAGTQ
jgi:hypothetical protein